MRGEYYLPVGRHRVVHKVHRVKQDAEFQINLNLHIYEILEVFLT